MANTAFLLLITISGLIGSDPTSYYSSPSIWSDQLISGPHFSLLHGNFKRNAMSPSSWVTDFSNDFTLLTSNQTRSKRAADPLSDYSGKLSTVARISNGISLLAGLINKNIPIDNVISELLHFGDVKLADVVTLQKTNIDAVTTQLNSIPSTLDTTARVKSLEENTIGMAMIRDIYKQIGDFKTFQTPSEYFAEAQTLKDDVTTDYAIFETVDQAISEALKKVDELENAPAVDKNTFKNYLSPITVLQGHLVTVESATDSFKQVAKKMEDYKKLADGESILKPVEQMLHLLSIFGTLPGSVTTDVAQIGANIDLIEPLKTTFAGAASDLALINKVVTSRLSPTPKKLTFTSGFPNGAADLGKLKKDIRDPAFESTVGDAKNFAKLSAGLKPLMDLTGKLDALEANLKTLTTSEVAKSAANAAGLQKLMKGSTVSLAEVTAVVNMFHNNKLPSLGKAYVTDAAKLSDNAKRLKSELIAIKTSNLVYPQPPGELATVKEVLEKLQTITQSEVQAVLTEFKTKSKEVKKVVEYLIDFQKVLQTAPVSSKAQVTAGEIAAAQTHLDQFLTDMNGNVVTQLNAIKDATDPVEAVVNAIKASRMIRDFAADDVKNIKLAVDTITQASAPLTKLQKTPDDMKKTDDVMKLVKLKDSQKTSATLGSAASPIYSMAELKGMDTTAIRTPTAFDTELGNVKDPQKKLEIQQKWGDHVAFLASLDSTINQIKAFEAKLSVDKDLRKLGAHLNDAKAVGDVKENIADKSEAVSILISETTTPNADLQALKTQLDTLAALDLQFSSHHSAFPDVQGALKSFFDFVTGFVTPKKQSAQGAGAAAAADTGLNIWMYALIGASVLGLFAIVGWLSWFFYKRHNRDTIKSWEEIKKFILKNYYSNLPQAIGFARGLMNEMDKEVGELKKKTKDPKKMRYNNLEVLMDTAVCLPDGRFINANWIKAQGGAQYIATQGPLEEVLADDEKKTVLKADTRADFLYMIVVHKSEFVVQLCDWVEEREDDDVRKARLERERQEDEDAQKIANEEERDRQLLELGTRRHNEYCARNYEKAGKYYDPGKGYSVTCGQYTVTTDKVEKGKRDGVLEIRHLTITDSTDKTVKHKFTHLFHNDWPDHSVPDDIEPVIEAVKRVNQSKKPIIVHCSAGIGRTVSLIAADVLARDIERHPWMRAAEMLKILRMSRYKGIQSATQCFFAFLCAIRLLIDQYGKSDPKSKEIWDNHLKVFNNVKDKMCDEDLKEKRRVQAEQKDPPKKMDNKPKKGNNKQKTTVKTEKSQQVDSVETSSSATTPQTTGGKGNGTPMGTPKSRGKGGADHVVIPMESGSEEE